MWNFNKIQGLVILLFYPIPTHPWLITTLFGLRFSMFCCFVLFYPNEQTLQHFLIFLFFSFTKGSMLYRYSFEFCPFHLTVCLGNHSTLVAKYLFSFCIVLHHMEYTIVSHYTMCEHLGGFRYVAFTNNAVYKICIIHIEKCYYMDELRNIYAKWKKSDTIGQILYSSISMKYTA